MERLGRYTLERKLTVGGMAEIYLAIEDGTGKRYVIKRVAQALANAQNVVAMFFDEARVLAQLNHPGIARVHDFGHDEGVLFLVMEHVDGENLRTITSAFAARLQKLTYAQCARIIARVALALDAAYTAKGLDGRELRVIHRDVSPHNVMLARNGEVKLIDFGVAKATSAKNMTAAGLIKGKFAYMSPEQLRGQALDNRSDLFCLGLVLYELLTLERAIPGQTDAEVVRNALDLKIAPIEWARPDIPPALRDILAELLSPDREQRPASGAAVSAALEAFVASTAEDVGRDALAHLITADDPTQIGRALISEPEPPAKRTPEPTRPMAGPPKMTPSGPRPPGIVPEVQLTLKHDPSAGQPTLAPGVPRLDDLGALGSGPDIPTLTSHPGRAVPVLTVTPTDPATGIERPTMRLPNFTPPNSTVSSLLGSQLPTLLGLPAEPPTVLDDLQARIATAPLPPVESNPRAAPLAVAPRSTPAPPRAPEPPARLSQSAEQAARRAPPPRERTTGPKISEELSAAERAATRGAYPAWVLALAGLAIVIGTAVLVRTLFF
ncbi:MAG: protein kinase [Myxococcaceae bacterium]|nr:protein kinase [Myxococcaceae bacterium]